MFLKLPFAVSFSVLHIYRYIYMVQNTYVIIIPRIGYEIIAQSS